MEALLAHSFDYLSSYEPSKIRKGLRQVEGLLAQICLSRPKQAAADKRRSMSQLQPKPLDELAEDPAFREFFKLQEGFQWNGMQVTRPSCAHVNDSTYGSTGHSCDASGDMLGTPARSR